MSGPWQCSQQEQPFQGGSSTLWEQLKTRVLFWEQLGRVSGHGRAGSIAEGNYRHCGGRAGQTTQQAAGVALPVSNSKFRPGKSRHAPGAFSTVQSIVQTVVRSTLSLTFVIAACRVVFNIKARVIRRVIKGERHKGGGEGAGHAEAGQTGTQPASPVPSAVAVAVAGAVPMKLPERHLPCILRSCTHAPPRSYSWTQYCGPGAAGRRPGRWS